MATVVDALVVTLGMDASGFQTGQRQSQQSIKATSDTATRSAKEMESRGDQASMFFAKIKTEAISLIGVLLGGKGLESFARDATKSLADLGRSAVNIGVGVSQLAALSNALERNGASATAAQSSLEGYARQVEDFRIGRGSAIIGYLNTIGASVNEDPLAVVAKFQKFVEENISKPDGAQIIQIEGAGLGYSKDMVNALIQMRTAAKLREEINRSYDLGVPTQDQVDRVTHLQNSFTALGQAAHQAGVNLLSDVSPALSAVADEMSKDISHHQNISEAVIGLSAALSALGLVRISANLMGLSGVVAAVEALVAALALAVPLAAGSYSTYLNGQTEASAQATAESQGYTEGVGLANDDGSFTMYRNPTTNDIKSWMFFDKRYNPALGGGSASPSANPPASGTSGAAVMEQTRAFWASKGFTPDQVAGILAAGPGAESKFNPDIWDSGHTSYGLYQDHADRLTSLFAKFGPHPTVDQQNQDAWEYVQQHPDLLAKLRASGSSGATASVWTKGFEIPANADAEAAKRASGSWLYLPRSPVTSPAPGFDAHGKPLPTGPVNPMMFPPKKEQQSSLTTGNIVINTKATDVKGIARDFASAARDAWLVQANRGLV